MASQIDLVLHIQAPANHRSFPAESRPVQVAGGIPIQLGLCFFHCFGLTARLGTISPLWGLRTEMSSSLIFLPINFLSSSPNSLMSVFRLVLFTAQADLPSIGFLRSMMIGALKPSGDSRMPATSMVIDFVPSGMWEPLSSAPACPALRLSSIVLRLIASLLHLPGYARKVLVYANTID